MSLTYGVPLVDDNPDGWGPTTMPENLKEVPFAVFEKGSRIGKAADWTQSAYKAYPGAERAAIPLTSRLGSHLTRSL